MEILNNITCSNLAYPWGKTSKVRLRDREVWGLDARVALFPIPCCPIVNSRYYHPEHVYISYDNIWDSYEVDKYQWKLIFHSRAVKVIVAAIFQKKVLNRIALIPPSMIFNNNLM